MKKISGFREIVNNYTCILCDLWGVVINGVNLYPGANECLEEIAKEGLKIIFITNATRQEAVLRDAIVSMGANVDIFKHIVSSGDFVRMHMSDMSSPFLKNGQKCFLIGNESFFNGMDDVQLVYNIDDADYVILGDTFATDDDIALLDIIADRNLPVVCANPDKGTMNGNIIKRCAGFLGDLYEKKNGTVYYYGKPSSSIYNYIIDNYKLSNEKIICIGDSLSTDILGAREKNFDSLLITSGMFNLTCDGKDVEAECNAQNILPTYYCEKFIF